MFKWFTKRTKPIPNTWTSFTLGIARCVWTHPSGKERADLIARPDGSFCCGSEYFSEDPSEMCWVPLGAGGSIFGSEGIAVKEIHALFPWSRDVKCEDRTSEGVQIDRDR